jgi:peptidoglycan/LPS O-acetylase OafA/YrhL
VSGTIKLSPAFSNPFTPYWNAAVRMAFFVIFALLLTGGRKEPPRKPPRSRTD